MRSCTQAVAGRDRCPTREEIYAVPIEQRWIQFDCPKCDCGCIIPIDDAPHCHKRIAAPGGGAASAAGQPPPPPVVTVPAPPAPPTGSPAPPVRDAPSSTSTLGKPPGHQAKTLPPKPDRLRSARGPSPPERYRPSIPLFGKFPEKDSERARAKQADSDKATAAESGQKKGKVEQSQKAHAKKAEETKINARRQAAQEAQAAAQRNVKGKTDESHEKPAPPAPAPRSAKLRGPAPPPRFRDGQDEAAGCPTRADLEKLPGPPSRERWHVFDCNDCKCGCLLDMGVGGPHCHKKLTDLPKAVRQRLEALTGPAAAPAAAATDTSILGKPPGHQAKTLPPPPKPRQPPRPPPPPVPPSDAPTTPPPPPAPRGERTASTKAPSPAGRCAACPSDTAFLVCSHWLTGNTVDLVDLTAAGWGCCR